MLTTATVVRRLTPMGRHHRDDWRNPDGPWQGRFRRRVPWSAPGLVIIACALVFLVQWLRGWRGFGMAPELQIFGEASWPRLLAGEWWRLVSYAFVHGNVVHLLLNILGLILFGRLACMEFGNRHWLGIFLAGAVGGAVAYLAVFNEPNQRLVGASAGIYALITATTLRMPDLPLSVPFLPGLSVRLRHVTLGLLAIEAVNTVAQAIALAQPIAADAPDTPTTQIASLAHLGGALTGFLYVRLATDTFETMVRESDRRERQWRDHQRQRLRREPHHVAAGRTTATPTEDPGVPARPVNFMEERVNPILEKLHAHGPASLSPEEKRILDEAAHRLRGAP
jgi:membrane associated rhomboid family serine protease